MFIRITAEIKELNYMLHNQYIESQFFIFMINDAWILIIFVMTENDCNLRLFVLPFMMHDEAKIFQAH